MHSSSPGPDPSDSEILADGRYLRLMRIGRWEYAERVGISGVITIVALTPDRRILLTEQYRWPMRARVIELPAGLCGDESEDQDEDMPTAAIRELFEETGWRAERMELLTAGPSSPGMTNEVITFFRAHDLHRETDGGGNAEESIRVHAIPLDEVQAWLRARATEGFYIDPLVYTGLFFLTRGF